MSAATDAIDRLGTALADALTEAPWPAAVLVSAVVEDMRMGCPMAGLTDIMADADWWASNATPLELEAHLIAIGKHLSETPVHIRTRKRIIAAMFAAMADHDKAAFFAWAQSKGQTDAG